MGSKTMQCSPVFPLVLTSYKLLGIERTVVETCLTATFRPRASHQTALTIFHLCTSFRTLSLTYAMMGLRTSMEPKHQGRRTQGRFPAVMEK